MTMTMTSNMYDSSSSPSKALDINGLMGHVLPASFFLGCGLCGLWITMRRLMVSSSTHDFMVHHVPERNMRLLRRIGIFLMISTTTGIIVEGSPHGGSGSTFIFRHLQHQTLYLLFGSAGLVAVLESYGRVPQDFFRGSIVLAFAGETILWHEHSLMKMDPIDGRVHALLTLTALASALSVMISMLRPNQLLPYVTAFLSMVWQGLWLIAAGYNIMMGGVFTAEQVSSVFCLQGVFLGLSSLLGVVVVHRQHEEQKKDAIYQRILVVPSDDEDDQDNQEEADDEKGSITMQVV